MKKFQRNIICNLYQSYFFLKEIGYFLVTNQSGFKDPKEA